MSSPTVQAVCPGCQHPLRIPRELVGKPVKCKKCGTVVRSKAKPEGDPSRHPVAAAAAAGVPQGYYPNGAPYYAPPAAQPNGQPHVAAHPYAPPPGYTYPAAPAHNPLELEPASSMAIKAHKGRGKYRRGSSGFEKFLWIAFGILMIGGVAFGGYYLRNYVKKNSGPQSPVAANPEVQQPAATPGQTPIAQSTNLFPRRLLFVQINNYLYLNPLTSAAQGGTGPGPDRTRAVAKQLAYEWRVPTDKETNQVYVLSDSGTVADSRAPYKNVINETFHKFFDSCRTQDRIFVYFGGHAIEKDGKAYLVPIEGDPEEVESLIPLDDYYAQLAACKAQQKVMVWDVCRYNPQRGKQRKGSEPMTAELEAALSTKAPPGVQVILTCEKDQNALEFFSQQIPGETAEYTVAGSSFLSAISYVAKKNKNKATGQSPTDPLPVQGWIDLLAKRTADVAASTPEGEDKKKITQTPKAYGAPKAEQVAYVPGEALPARFELPQPPKGASPQLVASIRTEIKLPPLLKAESGDDGLDSFPFPADKLNEYKSDVTDVQIMNDKETYKFESTVLESFNRIRDVWEGKAEPGAGTKTELRRVFEGETSDAAKKTIKEDQIYPAIAILTLQEVLMKLEKIADMREKATKRWQANYDFAMAQAKSRLAFMNEYNLLLGQIFTPEVLPVLDREKAGHTGWALASIEKMKSKKDVKQLVEDAQELYAKIIETYKGTPWEIQAKREKGIALGLEWQPYTPGSKFLD